MLGNLGSRVVLSQVLWPLFGVNVRNLPTVKNVD